MFDAQALLEIPGISALTFNDEQLIRTAFPKDGLQYARSWLYILRAAHVNTGELGYKFVSPKLVAVIGFRQNHFYVTPIFDISHGLQLQKLCRAIIKSNNFPLLIKKITDQQYNQVSYVEGSANLPLEDDTCSETVLRLDSLFIGTNQELNPALRKLERRGEAFRRLNLGLEMIEDIRTIPLQAILDYLAVDSEKYANYRQIITYLHTQQADRYKYRVIIFRGKRSGRLRGLYITEVLSLTEVGLYGGITSKDAGGITEWMDIHFFQHLHTTGIKELYLGGAENLGIASYITKLLPYKPAYHAKTVLFEYRAQAKELDFTFRLIKTSDFAELAQLYAKLYNSLDTLGETWTKESAHQFISHFYQRQSDLFLVAEHKGRLVGAIVAGVQPWWDGNHLVEGEVIVDPAYQATNVNRLLVKELLLTARNKYKVVTWDTFTPTSRKHPLGVYKEIGFNDVGQWAAISGDVRTVLERLGV